MSENNSPGQCQSEDGMQFNDNGTQFSDTLSTSKGETAMTLTRETPFNNDATELANTSSPRKRNKLIAQWVIVDNRLVCKWVIT